MSDHIFNLMYVKTYVSGIALSLYKEAMAPVPEPNNTPSPNSDELTGQVGPQVIQVSSDSDSDYEIDIHGKVLADYIDSLCLM